MFTGIITDIGEVRMVEQRGDLRARIGCAYDMTGVDIGASIACDGVCLTVVAKGADWFDVDISAETVGKTNIGTRDWPPAESGARAEGRGRAGRPYRQRPCRWRGADRGDA